MAAKLYVSIDRKYKSEDVIDKQIMSSKDAAQRTIGENCVLVHSLEEADYAWFVDEWEDDVDCYEDHETCLKNGTTILHDKSEFWNRA